MRTPSDTRRNCAEACTWVRAAIPLAGLAGGWPALNARLMAWRIAPIAKNSDDVDASPDPIGARGWSGDRIVDPEGIAVTRNASRSRHTRIVLRPRPAWRTGRAG